MPALPSQLQTPSNDAEAAVVAKGVLRAAAHLDIPHRALARMLGLSEASVSRLAPGAFRLDPRGKPFELALLFIRLFRSLDAITGGDQAAARAWLRADNLTLGDQPLNLMARLPGLIDVLAYLDARRAPV
jgi:Protein of unknown function (DUF2384)